MNKEEKKQESPEKEKGEKVLKRGGTMGITAQEGEAFLKTEGYKGWFPGKFFDRSEEKGVRTRSQQKARDIVQSMLDPKEKEKTEVTAGELDKEKSKFRMVFRLMDTNGDGKVNKKEMKSVLRSMGKQATDEKIAKIFEEADKNKSGTIEQTEFVNYMIKKQQLKKQKLKDAVAVVKPKTQTQKKKKKEESSEDEEDFDSEEEEKKPKKRTPRKKTESPAKIQKARGGRKQKAEKEEKEEKEEKKEKKEEDTGRKKGILKKGLSITDFYTPFAGFVTMFSDYFRLHEEIQNVERDKFNNPKGRGFDLGHEKAFQIFGVIFYNFVRDLPPEQSGYDPSKVWEESIKALKAKGFHCYEADSEDDFISKLDQFDEAWFNSSAFESEGHAKFVEAMKKFHEDGKGIAIWADNDPFLVQGSAVLEAISGVRLIGDTPGNNVLKVGTADTKGEFGKHLLTTGIVQLHEGVTICYPSETSKELKVLGTSTDGYPCVAYMEPEKKGRVVIDTGFTKLNKPYWNTTAGTERYVRNCAVWLLGLDYRMKVGAPLQGRIHIEKEVEKEENENGKQEVKEKEAEKKEGELEVPMNVEKEKGQDLVPEERERGQ